MKNLSNLFKKHDSRDEIPKFLKTTPDALEEFESIYKSFSEEENKNTSDFFKLNSRDVSVKEAITDDYTDTIIKKIVDELLYISQYNSLPNISDSECKLVTNEDLKMLPEENRPQLTGTLVTKDISEPVYIILLDLYKRYINENNSKDKMQLYHIFRQGLDIMDLDYVTYQIIDQNPNSMGYWFPALKNASENQDFFKIPDTKIVKVPLPILQLTRLDYMSLTPATLKIVDEWCKKIFMLDENKTYFIKTGTYSSKFDFRNAKVTSPKEVNEIGQYLLFIHHQALQMASPLSSPCIYGVSTTTEWVVREYIEDVENNPCIYHGMPLHTEYRVFVDLDTKEVLGNLLYWDSDLMKKRFLQKNDADTADMKHDYVIYSMHEDTIKERFNKNKDIVTEKIKELLPYINLSGQWSIDIMQNGDDFYIIDMATANTSALRDKLPEGIVKEKDENWIPVIK